MIARHRGDLRAHSRWRPSTPAPPPPATTEANEEDLLSTEPDELLGEKLDLDRRRVGQRKPRALIVMATIIAIAVIAAQRHSTSVPSASRLPSTPQQWVTQWTAATLQSPTAVCNRLYSPALTRAFKGGTGHSCAWYYTSVKSTSFRIATCLRTAPPRRSKPRRSARDASGATSPCSSATSVGAGKPSTSYLADQSEHARHHPLSSG